MKHVQAAISFALGAVLAATVTHGIDHYSHARHVKAIISKARAQWDGFSLADYNHEIFDKLSVLMLVRSNRLDQLITRTEQGLSHALSNIALEYPTEAPPKPEAKYFRMWKSLADYYAAYPFKTGEADVDEAVQEVVARVREQAKP